MSRKSYPNVNAANQYARDVVRGKIVACQFVIQACQRHLDDLMAEKSKSFRYRFDKDLAERAAKFIQLLPHTKGEWAFKRMPITLEPWQLFVICCAFGWVNKGSRLRRFREVYTEIPRKNGKSAISAGVALYCFACDNEFGAEVYSGATTEKQAWEVFRPARLMCKRTPMLTEAFGIEVNASNMNRPEDGARFEPLIGNPGDGSSPHCAVVDEYHEHATDALYTTMLTGMGARRQPLMWAITTAGYNIEGPCYDKRREVIEMLNGSVPAPRRMSSGLNCRRRRPFNIWRTGSIDQFQCVQIIQPQIILRQFLTFQTTNRRFTRPLLTVYVFVDLINQLLLFQFGCGNLFLMSWRWNFPPGGKAIITRDAYFPLQRSVFNKFQVSVICHFDNISKFPSGLFIFRHIIFSEKTII